MTIEFDLARALTAQSRWSDPKQIRGGRAELSADDIRAAVSISLVDHPFAFHGLMAKYCHDEISDQVLHEEMDEFGMLVFHEKYPNENLKASKHRLLVNFVVKVFYEPGVFVAMKPSSVDAMGAKCMKVHGDTWSKKYRDHFRRLVASLYELEATAIADYTRIMGRG